VGIEEGREVGFEDGNNVGDVVGLIDTEGAADGFQDGEGVGCMDGYGVGGAGALVGY